MRGTRPLSKASELSTHYKIRGTSRLSPYSSLVHQLLLALNVGFVTLAWILYRLDLRPGWSFGRWGLLFGVYVARPWWPAVYGAWTVVIALLVLGLLLLLRRTIITRLILDPVGGMVALCAIPAYWLPRGLRLGSPYHDSLERGLLLELAFVVALLAVTSQRPLHAFFAATLLIYHYGLWTFVVIDSVDAPWMVHYLTPYLLSPLAGIAWALYASGTRRAASRDSLNGGNGSD